MKLPKRQRVLPRPARFDNNSMKYVKAYFYKQKSHESIKGGLTPSRTYERRVKGANREVTYTGTVWSVKET